MIIVSRYMAIEMHSHTEQSNGTRNLKCNLDLSLKSINLVYIPVCVFKFIQKEDFIDSPFED